MDIKNYKFKFMNEAIIKEIEELWDNGHGEALVAWGYECANAGVEGYKKGYAIGTALALTLVGLGAGAIGYAIYGIKEELAFKQRTKGTKQHVENAN